MLEIDHWILLRAEDLVARCRGWYDDFAFHKVYHAVYDFATTDLSAIYFDVLKDRLYTSAAKSHARRSAQTALYRLLDALVRLLAPSWASQRKRSGRHLGQPGQRAPGAFPEPAELTEGLPELTGNAPLNWDRLMEVRDDVLKSLEEARATRSSSARRWRLASVSRPTAIFIRCFRNTPGAAGAVHRFPGRSWRDGEQRASWRVRSRARRRPKCERCWKYTTDTGSDPRFPTICAACAGAMDEILHG